MSVPPPSWMESSTSTGCPTWSVGSAMSVSKRKLADTHGGQLDEDRGHHGEIDGWIEHRARLAHRDDDLPRRLLRSAAWQ
jgi:hypothetical protein